MYLILVKPDEPSFEIIEHWLIVKKFLFIFLALSHCYVPLFVLR